MKNYRTIDKTIALLMTIPANEMTPRNAINPNDDPNANNPKMTSIAPSGIVRRTIINKCNLNFRKHKHTFGKHLY